MKMAKNKTTNCWSSPRIDTWTRSMDCCIWQYIETRHARQQKTCHLCTRCSHTYSKQRNGISPNKSYPGYEMNMDRRSFFECDETKKRDCHGLPRKHINTIVQVWVDDTIIETNNNLNYLGVSIDNKLNFCSHIRNVAYKATNVTRSLSRRMTNVKVQLSHKWHLLMCTTLSILLYWAEIWADALQRNAIEKD